jgi:hypothetical protein
LDEGDGRQEAHEKAIFDIKKKIYSEALKLKFIIETELTTSDLLDKREQLSTEKRQNS